MAISNYLPRLLEASLATALRVMPVAVVTGSRQTGKSTMVRFAPAAGDREYLSLDDLDVRDRARHSPESLVRGDRPVALDEVQREPDLLIAVKQAVDRSKAAGRFLLTGSADLLLLRSVSESLAGRAAYLTLWPMTRREQLGMGEPGIWSQLLESKPSSWLDLIGDQIAPAEPWADLALRGGYPPAAVELVGNAERAVWFDGYASTYLERDLRDLAAVDRITEFRRLMIAVCLRIGGLQNQTDLARDLALPPTTTQRYLDLLEVSYQLIRLPAFSVNRTKRLIKSPKLYWSDTGLALHLAGESTPRGPHLENLILGDLMAWRGARTDRTSILHWQTTKGAEVDFVIASSQQVLPIEVKATRRVRTADARHLEVFLQEYTDLATAGLLLYDGDDTFWLTRRVVAAPWWRVI